MSAALCGTVLGIAAADDPFAAVDKNLHALRHADVIKVPLRDEKKYPTMFEGFGWCTWDAFYQNVTSKGIYEKLEELKSKNIQIDWMIIDDGWQQFSDMKLTALEADPAKFPEGLGGAIRRIKEEYGVKYVGVWHTLQSYWFGIHPDSELCRTMQNCFVTTPSGCILPDFRSADSFFKFWDVWYKMLKNEGVDFVKVDNQSSMTFRVEGMMDNTLAIRNCHEGLERAVNLYFDGNIINCMGTNTVDLLTRPGSIINRSSDDFFPRRPDSFITHLYGNGYISPLHSQFHIADFDMWWSGAAGAKQSAVLRAISGGPVYVSDEVGKTDATYIRPFFDHDGRLLRCEQTAAITLDCFYTDCLQEKRPFKMFNRCGENFVVAAFGLSKEISEGALRLDNIPGASGEYVATEYFSGDTFLLDEHSELPVRLGKFEVCLWNLYRVHDGAAEIGAKDVYMGCAAAPVMTVKTEDIRRI